MTNDERLEPEQIDAEFICGIAGWSYQTMDANDTSAFQKIADWINARTQPKPHGDERAKALEALDDLEKVFDEGLTVHGREMFETVRAALSSPPMASGCVMVPEEPAQDMQLKGLMALVAVVHESAQYVKDKGITDVGTALACMEVLTGNDSNSIYKAMLSARPPCPTASEATGKVDADPVVWLNNALSGKGYGPFTDMTVLATEAVREIERLRATPQPPAQSWEWIEKLRRETFKDPDPDNERHWKWNSQCSTWNAAIDCVIAEAKKRHG